MSLLGWTLSFLRPYRTRVVIITALSIVEVGLAALTPWFLKTIIDNVLGGQPMAPWLASAVDRLIGPHPVTLLTTIAVTGLVLQLLREVVMMLHT